MLYVPFGGIIVAAGAMLALFNEIGAYLNGEDSWIKVMIEDFKTAWQFIKQIAGAIERVAVPFAKAAKEQAAPVVDFFDREKGAFFAPGRYMLDMFSKMSGGETTKETNFNNTFIINGTANAADVAGEVVNLQQNQFNHAYSDANNGSVY